MARTILREGLLQVLGMVRSANTRLLYNGVSLGNGWNRCLSWTQSIGSGLGFSSVWRGLGSVSFEKDREAISDIAPSALFKTGNLVDKNSLPGFHGLLACRSLGSIGIAPLAPLLCIIEGSFEGGAVDS